MAETAQFPARVKQQTLTIVTTSLVFAPVSLDGPAGTVKTTLMNATRTHAQKTGKSVTIQEGVSSAVVRLDLNLQD